MIEVRRVYLPAGEDHPYTGHGTLIVTGMFEHAVRLMHPVSLEEFHMRLRDLVKDGEVIDPGFINNSEDDDLLWPVNKSTFKFSPDGLIAILRHSYQRRCLYGTVEGCRSTVKEVLVALSGLSPEEVEGDLKALEEATRSMPKPRGVKPKQLNMEGVMAPKKKASNHRDGVCYVGTQKLDPDKFKGQRNLVAKALTAFSTPKNLETIVKKVESNGGYKVNADGGITDSVHFHLRELVKNNVVKEIKEEEPKETATPKKKKAKAAEESAPEAAETSPEEAETCETEAETVEA